MAGEMDLQNYNLQMSGMTTEAAKGFAEGTSDVAKQVREDDKRDVVEKSEKEVKPEDVAGFVNPAALPMLAPPQINAADVSGLDQVKTSASSNAYSSHSTAASGSAYSQQPSDALEGTMRGVLDAWGAATEKYVKASKEHNANMKAEQAIVDDQRWVQDVLQMGVTNPHTTVVSAIMAAGMTGVMAGHKIDPTDPQHLAFRANENGIMAATVQTNNTTENLGYLGQLGALLMTPAGSQALALTIGNAEKTQPQNLTKDFAKNYGDRLLNMVNDKNFTGWLQTIIQAKAPGEGAVSPEKLAELTASFKLGMLMSAYAVAYKAQYGGVSGKEIMAEIKTLDLEGAGSKAALLDAIRQLVGDPSRGVAGQIPAGQRDAVMAQLSNWIDSDPKIASLMNPIEVFQKLGGGKQVAQDASIAKPA